MERIAVAFGSRENCRRICTVLESSGCFSCVPCQSAGEVKRLTGQQRIGVVVCGYKLADITAEELCQDLPAAVCVLVMAPQGQLDLCRCDRLFRLPTPSSRGELVASVQMLTQMNRRLEQLVRSGLGEEERQLLEAAKALLMERRGMTEEQAHRYIQKKSMDAGSKIAQTARKILEGPL